MAATFPAWPSHVLVIQRTSAGKSNIVQNIVERVVWSVYFVQWRYIEFVFGRVPSATWRNSSETRLYHLRHAFLYFVDRSRRASRFENNLEKHYTRADAQLSSVHHIVSSCHQRRRSYTGKFFVIVCIIVWAQKLANTPLCITRRSHDTDHKIISNAFFLNIF